MVLIPGTKSDRTVSYINNTEAKVAENSLQVIAGNIVKLENNFIGLADSTSRIEGIAMMTQNFASDNQTGEKLKVNYIPKKFFGTADIKISGGLVTQSDVGKLFNITSLQEIDYATGNFVTGQFRLEEFKQGGLVGEFSIYDITGN